MKIEEIQKMWDVECVIDPLKIKDEAISEGKLRNKYHKLLMRERYGLLSAEQALNRLKLEKFEFYTQGHTEETREKGWKLPPIGKVLIKDVKSYVDADPDVIKQVLKIGAIREKIGYLEEIKSALMGRHWEIKNHIEMLKYLAGN